MSQTRLAIMAGISREHLNRIETGKVNLTDDMQDKLMEAVEKFNPDAPMFLLFDYVRIRFPTLDIQHVIRDILKLNIDYTRTRSITIWVMCSSTPRRTRKKARFWS